MQFKQFSPISFPADKSLSLSLLLLPDLHTEVFIYSQLSSFLSHMYSRIVIFCHLPTIWLFCICKVDLTQFIVILQSKIFFKVWCSDGSFENEKLCGYLFPWTQVFECQLKVFLVNKPDASCKDSLACILSLPTTHLSQLISAASLSFSF